jgi:hypothetical protein
MLAVPMVTTYPNLLCLESRSDRPIYLIKVLKYFRQLDFEPASVLPCIGDMDAAVVKDI